VTASAYDTGGSPQRCPEGLCPSCDTVLFGSASTSLWCPDCDQDWSFSQAQCPYPATATTSVGERLCRVHAPVADDVWHEAQEC
jgi:uncharacterized Zn finger protein (UPF0148 family)